MNDPCETNEGIRSALLRRILLLWRVKLALTMFMPVWVFVPYVILQRWPIAPIHVYEQSSLDRLVEFDPAWVWVYVSVYLLVPIPIWLTASKSDLKLYAKGIVWICIISWIVFAVHPVHCPRPDPLPRSNMLFELVIYFDLPTNSFPSLHISVASYALFYGGRLRSTDRVVAYDRLGLAMGWLWFSFIAYATLATKQHFIADVLAGLALSAAVGSWLLGRSSMPRDRFG